jgi:hypothetical protein
LDGVQRPREEHKKWQGDFLTRTSAVGRGVPPFQM